EAPARALPSLYMLFSFVAYDQSKSSDHREVRLDGIKAGNRDQDLFQGWYRPLTSRFSRE
ncbi:MAG: hypothetical protein MUP44_02450, partial [Anaerolineales bacterium]|nr:hypothetical protein [Anaerolineales bacterium]